MLSSRHLQITRRAAALLLQVASPTAQQLSPARIDHLVGGACAPSSSEPQPGSPGLHGSGRASPKVGRHAAVAAAACDHGPGLAATFGAEHPGCWQCHHRMPYLASWPRNATAVNGIKTTGGCCCTSHSITVMRLTRLAVELSSVHTVAQSTIHHPGRSSRHTGCCAQQLPAAYNVCHASSCHQPLSCGRLTVRRSHACSARATWHCRPAALLQVNLRAAVDHLAGVACAVQQVEEVATADAPLPQVQRGMATKLTKDRMVSHGCKPFITSCSA